MTRTREENAADLAHEARTKTHRIKLVLGETAAKMHESGLPDDKIGEWGSIEEYTFATRAELDAFILGLNTLDGWMGWTEHDPANLDRDEED